LLPLLVAVPSLVGWPVLAGMLSALDCGVKA
jgi:hypothetical protein